MPLDNLSYNSPSAPDYFDRLNAFKDSAWNDDYGPDYTKLEEVQVLAEALDHKVKLMDFTTDDAKTFQDQFSELMEAVSQELADALHLLEIQKEVL